MRHSKSGYVYIAGTLSGRLIKIGTAKDIPQRERQLRAEGYAGFSDWVVLFSIWVDEAGKIERDASARVAGRAVCRSYFKDGFEQTAIEALECSFGAAMEAVKEVLGPTDDAEPWKATWAYRYEFDHSA